MPQISETVTINGVPVVLTNQTSYSVRVGDVVSVTSNMPTTWTIKAAGTGTVTGFSVTSTTPATWSANVAGPSNSYSELTATSSQLDSNLKFLYFTVQ